MRAVTSQWPFLVERGQRNGVVSATMASPPARRARRAFLILTAINIMVTTVRYTIQTTGQGDVRDMTTEVASALRASQLTDGIARSPSSAPRLPSRPSSLSRVQSQTSSGFSRDWRPARLSMRTTNDGETTTDRATCARGDARSVADRPILGRRACPRDVAAVGAGRMRHAFTHPRSCRSAYWRVIRHCAVWRAGPGARYSVGTRRRHSKPYADCVVDARRSGVHQQRSDGDGHGCQDANERRAEPRLDKGIQTGSANHEEDDSAENREPAYHLNDYRNAAVWRDGKKYCTEQSPHAHSEPEARRTPPAFDQLVQTMGIDKTHHANRRNENAE